jgi:hypothetical protein
MFFHYNNHVKGSFLRKLRAEKYSDEGAIPSAHNYQDQPFTSLAPERPAGAYQESSRTTVREAAIDDLEGTGCSSCLFQHNFTATGEDGINDALLTRFCQERRNA